MIDGPSSPEHTIALEVSGEGVCAETVDAPLLLEIASSFFALVQGNAREEQKDLAIRGISITNKCVQVAAMTTQPDMAQFFVQKAHLQIAGELPAAHGCRSLIKRAQNALRRAPADWVIRYQAGSWSRSVALTPKKIRPMKELLALRATVHQLTGSPHPQVRLSARTESRSFTLKAKKELIKRLVILSEIDAQAVIQRDADGAIETGRLIDFEPVSTESDAIAEWTDWYQQNAAEWDAVQDIEGQLKARSN